MQTYVFAMQSGCWKNGNSVEATIWLLSKQPRALKFALDLYYKLLEFGWKRKSIQKDRQGYSWTAKERIQVGEYHLGSLWKTLPIFLKPFSKSTKLGSLFPKVKPVLWFFSLPPFQVRAENYWPFHMQTYVFAYNHGQNFRFKRNTSRRCSNCLKTGFWTVYEVDNMPTSQHTR